MNEHISKTFLSIDFVSRMNILGEGENGKLLAHAGCNPKGGQPACAKSEHADSTPVPRAALTACKIMSGPHAGPVDRRRILLFAPALSGASNQVQAGILITGPLVVCWLLFWISWASLGPRGYIWKVRSMSPCGLPGMGISNIMRTSQGCE